ncbi:uncharacterized protein ELE39_000568 [Cryptosporidium sp. chipmunk genotype I]|uniref:uncharacterized protein n=1 Tax=Cryptosporidium sp. chipmunk genotype I TaxID=1280935 RepID=UPI00351A4C23|nr:hypothetical protein ELE39_000568 [Cryptosporidium sp. chipmunk genotype I]
MRVILFLVTLIFSQIHFNWNSQNELVLFNDIDKFSFLTAAHSLSTTRRRSNSRLTSSRTSSGSGVASASSEFKRLSLIDVEEQECTKFEKEVLFEDVACEILEELLSALREEFEELEHNAEPLISSKTISVCLSQLKEIEHHSDSTGMAQNKSFKMLMQSITTVSKAERDFLNFVSKLERQMSIVYSLIAELGTLISECVDSILVEFEKLIEIKALVKDLQLMNKMVRNVTRHLQHVLKKHCQDRYLRTTRESIIGLKSQLSKKLKTKRRGSPSSHSSSSSTSRPHTSSRQKSYMAQTISSQNKKREKYTKTTQKH